MCNDRLVKFFDKSVLCLSPVLIPNPNKGRFVSSLQKAVSDCDSAYISVPCGYCKQCIAVKQMYFVQRAIMESFDSFMYFTTLTYSNDMLPRLSTSTGFEIPFADVRHLQLLMKRLRRNNSFGRPFRYFAVSERGTEKSRPHFHIIWFLPKYVGEDFSDGLSFNSVLYPVIRDNWVVNVGSDKKPIYKPLFEFHQKYYRGKLFSNYDTHFIVPSLTKSGFSSVAFYACKYLFKVNPKEARLQQAFKLNLDPDEYESSWSLVKSRSFASVSFGLGGSHNRDHICSYIKHCIDVSDRSLHYPQFFNPDSGQCFPLSPFYKSREQFYPYWVASEFDKDSPFVSFDKSLSECLIAEQEFYRISNIVDKDLSMEFNFLFD